jgi:alpha-L-fucosidase
MSNAIGLICAMVAGGLMMAAEASPPAVTGPDTRWFTDAGFGIFLHWGAYSQSAGRWKGKERTRDLWGEWIWHRAGIGREENGEFARTFNPASFDGAEWERAFKESGARYVILTAKHPEGFAMYRSKASPFNSYDWPASYHGEPVRELGDAVRKAGLRFGVYYSQQVDWRHYVEPGAEAADFDFGAYFRSVCLPQVRELLTGYGPMAVMWFDIGIRDKGACQELKDLVRNLQPKALVSPRIGSCGGDYDGAGDSEVPTLPQASPWESCMTLNHHFAAYPQDVYQKSATEVIRMLAEIRGKGGNLLLGIGPDSEGRLAPRDVVVLR